MEIQKRIMANRTKGTQMGSILRNYKLQHNNYYAVNNVDK